MTRSHPDSNYPCDCGLMDIQADDPKSPIAFDTQTNEYHLRRGEGTGSYLVCYYCPSCGGKMPDSRRQALFKPISSAEIRRLQDLTREIKSIDDALRILGAPDDDLTHGVTIKTRGSDTEAPRVKSYRVLKYWDLSDSAAVEVADHPNSRYAVQFTAKPVESGSISSKNDPPIRAKDSPALKDRDENKSTQYCSFCNSSEHGVERMLTGKTAAICDECAELFVRGARH